MESPQQSINDDIAMLRQLVNRLCLRHLRHLRTLEAGSLGSSTLENDGTMPELYGQSRYLIAQVSRWLQQ